MSSTIEIQIDNSTRDSSSHTTAMVTRSQRMLKKQSSPDTTPPQPVHEPLTRKRQKASSYNLVIQRFLSEQISRAPRHASICEETEEGYVLQMHIPRCLSHSSEMEKLITSFERRSSLRLSPRKQSENALDSESK